jgi:tryptophan-rich sensory protein
MKKQKTLISIATLIVSSIIGVIIINQSAPTPFQGAELFMFYLLEMGMILALPALSPLFLSDVNGAADNIAVVLLLIILSFTTLGGWIWILRKSKKAWLITIPILIWVTIGSVLTFATLCMSV